MVTHSSEGSLTRNAKLLGVVLALMWAIEALDSWLLGSYLQGFGIRPWSAVGLAGIPSAPFLHVDWGHLLANSVPFLVLGWLVAVRGLGEFVEVTVLVVGFGGLGTWLLADKGTNHVGASGLIFGYFGFLLLRAYFDRSPGSLAIAVLVGVVYGGLVWGIFPSRSGAVSWEGHMSGFIGGGVTAWLLTRFGGSDGEET